MANDIQSAIFTTIETIVNKTVEAASFDRTVTASILSCVNALTNEYKLSYQGGTFYALAEEGATYSANQAVYVLVPEGDFSKTKRIIGTASFAEDNTVLSAVSANINNLTPVGKSVVNIKNVEESAFGIKSKSAYSAKVLYQYDKKAKTGTQDSLLIIDNQELNNVFNTKEVKYLLVEGTFSNDLPLSHKRSSTGEFGVACVIAWDTLGEDYDYVLYDFSSKSMMGNPLKYGSLGVTQNFIFPIEDGKEFHHIETIVFYAKGFEEENYEEGIFDEENIFLRDLILQGLKTITSTNGEYSLEIKTPMGITFEKDLSIGEINPFLTAYASFKRKNSVQSTGIEYLWFIEDPSVQDVSSEGYSVYAGAGWRKLNFPNYRNNIEIHLFDCSAYITKFMCVAIAFDSITLKEEFIVYNEAENRIVEIVSDSGTSFAHNVGAPTLTCLVSDIDGNSLASNYDFTWSKIQQDKTEILLVKNYEEWQEEIDLCKEKIEELQDDQNDPNKKNEIQRLEAQIQSCLVQQMHVADGVWINNDQLIYPIKKIVGATGAEKIKCSLFTKTSPKKFAGSAEITLVNGKENMPQAYHVVVKNGNQVFQYSESGISPTSDRYQEPQNILPLEAILYAPDGSLVENKGVNAYSVSWQFPAEKENTLIDLDKNVTLNEVTGKYDLLLSEICNFSIKDEYNTQAKDNQIICLVDYRGMKISGSTNFLFTKIGEDGTNGTDIVAKIEPILNKTEIATFFLAGSNKIPCIYNETKNNFTKVENDIKSNGLEVKLFNRGEEVIPTSVSWKFNLESCFSFATDGTFTSNDQMTELSPAIAQANCVYNSNNYYANYAVPVIHNHLVWDENREDPPFIKKVGEVNTLRSVLYNKDGRNPVYKTTSGIELILENMEEPLLTKVKAEVKGGIDKKEEKIGPFLSIGEPVVENNRIFIPVTPKEEFLSGLNNNYVQVTLGYGIDEKVASVYVPIHMSLNTYGLASLNAWDGNKIEINEDNHYIMAPQMGAGTKNNKNQFTGIVMGRAQFGDDKEEVGLFGLKDGRQSIFLDAKTGAATFGLKEADLTQLNLKPLEQEQYCGRIHLNPKGESYISSWRIGQKSLYNINGENESSSGESLLGAAQSHHPEGAVGSIPRDKQGVILSGNPAFISVKSKPQEGISFSDESADSTNSLVGKSFEVLLDPNNDESVFNILKHTVEVQDPENYIFSLDSNDNKTIILKKNDIRIGTFNQDSNKWKFKPEAGIIPIVLNEKVDSNSLTTWPWTFVEAKEIIGKSFSYEYKDENGIKRVVNYLPAEINNQVVWRVEPTAYLDSEGNLNANSLRKDNVKLDLGYISALEESSFRKTYKGFTFAHNETDFFKVFMNLKDTNDSSVYVTAKEQGKEYSSKFTFLGTNFKFLSSKPGTTSEARSEFSNQGVTLGIFNLSTGSNEDNSNKGYSSLALEDFINKDQVFDGENNEYFYSKDRKEYYPLNLEFNDNKGFAFIKDDKEQEKEDIFTIKLTNSKDKAALDSIEDNNGIPKKYYLHVYPYLEGSKDSYSARFFYKKEQDAKDDADRINYLEDVSVVNNLSSATYQDVYNYTWDNAVKENVDWFYSSKDKNIVYGTKKVDSIYQQFRNNPQTIEKIKWNADNSTFTLSENETESINADVYFWGLKSYQESEAIRYFIPDLSKITYAMPNKDQNISIKIQYFQENESGNLVEQSELISLNSDASSVIYYRQKSLTNLDTTTKGNFLRLKNNIRQNRLESTSAPFYLSAQKVYIRGGKYKIEPVLKSENSVRLTTEDNDSRHNHWRLTLMETTGDTDKYLARFSNAKNYEEKEGLFFSGAKKGKTDKNYRSALFTSSGFILQNTSAPLKANNRSRLGFIDNSYGTIVQDIGEGGLWLESIPSSLKKAYNSVLRLKGGSRGTFFLSSNCGVIESGRFTINGTEDTASIRINAPLRLWNGDKPQKWQSLNCGQIRTNGNEIRTEGGTIRTGGGNLNLGDEGGIYGLKSIEGGFTVNGKMTATGGITANDFFL